MSYFSSLLTTTTSRVANLRQNLLPSENDGDTVDDTLLCRSLRGYYNEKGRPRPDWLPPDPKAPAPAMVQPDPTSNVGATYGDGMAQRQASRQTQFSSLWDSESQSQGRGRARALPPARQSPFASKPQAKPVAEVQARRLPSEREGSVQKVNARAFERNDMQPGSSAGLSAKQKFAGRFGGRSQSPALTAPDQGDGRYTAPAGFRDYEHRSMLPAGAYGESRNEGEDKPFMAASQPWFDKFGQGGDSNGQSSGRQGLPNGPAAGRREPGRGYR